MDPINVATAQAVRDAIHNARKTQAFVKRGARIPSTTWKTRMRGERSFTVPELNRVARLLGMSLGDLLDDATERVA